MKKGLRKAISYLLTVAMVLSLVMVAPVDGSVASAAVTDYITNGNFGEGTTGWTITPGTENQSTNIQAWTDYDDNTSLLELKAEWVQDAEGGELKLSQTIPSLPVGTYRLTVHGKGDAAKGIKIYAGSDDITGTWTDSARSWDGWETFTKDITISDNTAENYPITLGFWLENADKTYQVDGISLVSLADIGDTYTVDIPSVGSVTAGEQTSFTADVQKNSTPLITLGTETITWFVKDNNGGVLGEGCLEDSDSLTTKITFPAAGTYWVNVEVYVDAVKKASDYLEVTVTAADDEEPTATTLEAFNASGTFEGEAYLMSGYWTIQGNQPATYTRKDNTAKDGTYSFGFWDSGAQEFICTQIIDSLPAGNYKLSLDAAGADSTVTLYFGTAVVEGEGATVSPSGWNSWENISSNIVVSTDMTNVAVGFKVVASAGGYGNIDNVSLTEISDVTIEELQALISKAGEINVAEMTGETAASLTSALTAARAITISSTNSEITTAYNNLKAAMAGLKYKDETLTIKKVAGLAERDEFIKGVDISSYVTEVNSGVVFKNQAGQQVDGVGFIKTFADAGVNYIRIRVWNAPYDASGNYYGGGNNDLEMAKKLCQYINSYNTQYSDNIKVLVDLQYSDFWADPDKQTKPKAWSSITDINELTAKVSEFTTNALTTIRATGVTIGMVQVGNETNTGICGQAEETDGYYAVFKAGCDAVKAFDANIKRVVHFTDPQTEGKAVYFATSLKNKGVDYDVYATSYYPYWHGTMENLEQILKDVVTATGKEVMVAETQEIYTNEDYDGSDNQAYEGKNNIDTSKYPVSVQGQANEIRDVINAVASVGEQGIGMFYWEPAWLGVGYAYNQDGTLNEEALAANRVKWNTYGSGWAADVAEEYDISVAEWGGGGTNNENASLFDFNGNPLPSLNVFKYVNYGSQAATASYYSYDALEEISVKVGTNADQLRAALPTSVGYKLNDDSTGTATPTWSETSIAAVVASIGTTSAIGNSYTVTGTIDVAGSTYTVRCNAVVIPASNLLTNGDFEAGSEGWSIDNTDMLCVSTENPKNSGGTCIAFNTYGSAGEADANGCYTGRISQTIAITTPGTYEARAFFEGGSGSGTKTGEAIYISVQCGETVVNSDGVRLAGWMNWQCPVVTGVVVTQDMIDAGINTITVSATVRLQADSWGSLDDFYLYRLDDENIVIPENPDPEIPINPNPGEPVNPNPGEPVNPAPAAPANPALVPAGTQFTESVSNAVYTVTTAEGQTVGTVEYTGPADATKKTVVIPDTVTINGVSYLVTSIAAGAFKGNKKLTQVTMGANVQTIGANAFLNCKKLKKVVIGANVVEIGSNAFKGDKKLTTVKMSAKLESVGNGAFQGCTSLKKIVLPATVKNIGKKAFYGDKKLKSITIKSKSLTKKAIGAKAFKGISKSATVKVPKSKVSTYKKLLRTKGLSKKAKVKK